MNKKKGKRKEKKQSVCVCACVHVCVVCACVCVCVCEWERERETEKRMQTDEKAMKRKRKTKRTKRPGPGWYLGQDRRASGPYCVVSPRGPRRWNTGLRSVESTPSYTPCYDTLLTTVRCRWWEAVLRSLVPFSLSLSLSLYLWNTTGALVWGPNDPVTTTASSTSRFSSGGTYRGSSASVLSSFLPFFLSSFVLFACSSVSYACTYVNHSEATSAHAYVPRWPRPRTLPTPFKRNNTRNQYNYM